MTTVSIPVYYYENSLTRKISAAIGIDVSMTVL